VAALFGDVDKRASVSLGVLAVLLATATGAAGQFVEQPKIVVEAAANARFGGSVAVEDDTAIVGAGGLETVDGYAYILNREATTGVWTPGGGAPAGRPKCPARR